MEFLRKGAFELVISDIKMPDISGIELLKKIGWNEKLIIDMGDITSSRATEMLLPIWVRLWGKLQTPLFNFNVVVADN